MKTLLIVLTIVASMINYHSALACDDGNCNDGGIATYKAELTPKTSELRRQVIVKNNQINLSALTKIVNNDLALTLIYSTITVEDAISLYTDYIYLKQKTDIRNWKIYINSGGGSAFDGIALADLFLKFREDGFSLHAYASGIVASATIPILAVCNDRTASANTIFLVHDLTLVPNSSMQQNDITSQNELITIIRKNYLKLLSEHTKLSAKKWQELKSKQTWFDASKALQWGLIDKIE